MVHTNSSIKYRPDIDGFRALAVLSVLVFHLNGNWLTGGFLGVDVFFVISGFLITSIIRNEILNGTFTFRRFYTRRIKRILPLVFTLLFVTTIAVAIFYNPQDYSDYLRTAKYTIQFLANFAFLKASYFDVLSEEKPLMHLWSLAIEEQFYFIWPLVMFFCFRFVKNKQNGVRNALITVVVLIIISTIMAEWLIHENNFAVYVYPHTRAAELLVGCFLALITFEIDKRYQTWLGMLGLAIVVGSLIFYTPETRFPGVMALIPAVGAALFIADTNLESRYKRFFTLNVVRTIGLWSFSLYVWHWPVLAIMRYIYNDTNLPLSWLALAVCLTFALSIFSYYCVENPVRRKKLTFTKSFITIYIIPVILFFGLMALLKMPPFRSYVYLPDRTEEVRFYPEGAQLGCYGNKRTDCNIGDTTQENRVLLIGDSHANHYIQALNIIGKKEGVNIEARTEGGCVPIFNNSKNHPLRDDSYERCEELIEFFVENWRNYDEIIISGFWYPLINPAEEGSDYNFLAKLIDTAQTLSDHGKKVYLLMDNPDKGTNPTRYIKFQKLGLDSWTYPLRLKDQSDKNEIANAQIIEATKDIPNVVYRDIQKYIPEDLMVDGQILYYDKDHISVVGSRILGELFIQNEVFFDHSDESDE